MRVLFMLSPVTARAKSGLVARLNVASEPQQHTSLRRMRFCDRFPLAWGFDRCLWGTDWAGAYAVVNYEQAVEPFLKTDRLSDSERAMLKGGASAKAYSW